MTDKKDEPTCLTGAHEFDDSLSGIQAIVLPETFEEGTLFADIEGVPASLTTRWNCRAWDVPGGRIFCGASFVHNGTLLDEATFRAWVKSGCPDTGYQVVH
jgi:hypothetical protein